MQVAPGRQARPNLPGRGCPFCVGGLESPEPYVVRSFPNRWPSFPDARCEVVLYGPEHGTSLAALGAGRARQVVDLWADRTAGLGARHDVDHVLVFENHGAEVGATIDHPHGQVFAYRDVPPAPRSVMAALAAGAPLLEDHLELVVFEQDGWRAWVPHASAHPHQVRLAPVERHPDLPSLDGAARDGLARALVRLLGSVERLFASAVPYLFWWVQQPTGGGPWPEAWLHLELICPWRADGLARFVAAGELGGGVLVNPVDPADAARRLREAG